MPVVFLDRFSAPLRRLAQSSRQLPYDLGDRQRRHGPGGNTPGAAKSPPYVICTCQTIF